VCENDRSAHRASVKKKEGGPYLAFILAACLRRNGATATDTLVQVEALARDCRPALPHGECIAVVRSVCKDRSRKMSYRYIADQLAVTPAEAQSITEHLRKPFPAAHESPVSAPGNGPPANEPPNASCAAF
jgi:hypothetical protein